MKLCMYLTVAMVIVLGAVAQGGEEAAWDNPVAKATNGVAENGSEPAKDDDALPEDDHGKDRSSHKKGQKPKDKASPDKQPLKLDKRLTGEFAEMARAGKLSATQQQTLLAVQTAMENALDDWDRTNKNRIAATEQSIQKAKNQRTKAQLQKQLERVKAGRQTLTASYHRRALQMLTSRQRGEYNGPKLWDAVQKTFGAVKLDAAQIEKALNICKSIARASTQDVTKSKTLPKQATSRIYSQVLTREQKKEYAKSRSPRRKQARRPGG